MRPFDSAVTPPGSKSLTNRALLLAALADGSGGRESALHNALIDADDTRVMIDALRLLGAEVRATIARRAGGGSGRGAARPAEARTPSDAPTLHVRGTSGRWPARPSPSPGGLALDLGDSGTAVRFLAAAAILAAPGAGPVTIDGSARMRERPIAELLAVLRSLGARVEHVGAADRLPVRIMPPGAFASDPVVEFGRTASSQFISAMLLVAPFLPGGLTVRLRDRPTSPAYVSMTLGLMRRVGVQWVASPSGRGGGRAGDAGEAGWRVPPQAVAPFTYAVESDASSASYFLAAAALSPGSRIRIDNVPGTKGDSLQGDVEFRGVLAAMGLRPVGDAEGISLRGPAAGQGLRPFTWDFSGMPDTAMTAAALACFASPTAANPSATSTLRGLRTLRHKESDRLAALQAELARLGATVEIESGSDDETLRITPSPHCAALPLGHSATSPPRHLDFETYNDHRLAMSLALVGLRVPGVHIRNPACVAKTYPTFWRDLARLYEDHGQRRATAN